MTGSTPADGRIAERVGYAPGAWLSIRVAAVHTLARATEVVAKNLTHHWWQQLGDADDIAILAQPGFRDLDPEYGIVLGRRAAVTSRAPAAG